MAHLTILDLAQEQKLYEGHDFLPIEALGSSRRSSLGHSPYILGATILMRNSISYGRQRAGFGPDPNEHKPAPQLHLYGLNLDLDLVLNLDQDCPPH